MSKDVELTQSEKSYGFVILHYMAFDMTRECVLRLLDNFKEYNIHIVVVDNASNNGSGKELRNFFQDETKVDVILNDENEGFARGNNIGYKFLNEHYDLNFAVIMNNDVLIEQNDFLELVNQIYDNTNFGVLGPDIFCPATGEHQSPIYLAQYSEDELIERYEMICKSVIHPRFSYLHEEFCGFRVKAGAFRRKLLRQSMPEKKIDHTKSYTNIALHGACYILSEQFIKQRENCFFPDTFLYFEEDILYYECLRDRITTFYDPQIRVKHLEDVSTNMAYRTKFLKFRMKNEEMKKSIEVFLRLLETDNKEGKIL